MDEYMQTIRGVMATLDGVSAEGHENWLRLLSCRQALENMLAKMDAEKQQEE